MGELLDTAKALASPVEKLIETVAGAIGTLYEPLYVKKMAEAKAREFEIIGESLRKNRDIGFLYENGSITGSNMKNKDILKRVKDRIIYQELKNQNNIDAVVNNAYKELKKESKVSDNPVDEDWISRFFNIIKDINSESMQFIWGKILAGEIKSPGSFSLRTLEVIRNLSQNDAKSFQKIIPIVLKFHGYNIISQNMDILEKYNIVYHDLLVLDECGLIKMKSEIGINVSISKAQEIYSQNRILFFKEAEKSSCNLTYRTYPLTSAGQELYSILNKKSNTDYIIDFAKDVVQENSKLKMEASIHKIDYISEDNSITFSKETIFSIRTENV